MSGISKRVSGSWVSGDYGIMETSTDTITTLPADIYANDTTATVGLKGQMVQSSTPSPTTPIQPSECGDRTGNLFDYSAVTTGYRIQWANGATYADDSGIMSDYIPVTEGDYTLNISSIIIGYAADKSYIGVYRSEETWEKLPSDPILSFTVLSNTNVEFVRLLTYGIYSPITDALMLNTGSTALPYEPYGYKIPISSASTTTPVYLGEVETTRKIVKKVFDGTETIFSVTETLNTTGLYCFGYLYSALGMADIINYDTNMTRIPYPLFISSHFTNKSSDKRAEYNDISDGEMGANSVGGSAPNRFFIMCVSGINSENDFKQWLTDQYTNGTPVTVWYILENETTGIVNEPIRKIGNYADTVSGITIPTIAGANSFDVLTTLKPSEVTVNYKGWHPVADVHERENGAWT